MALHPTDAQDDALADLSEDEPTAEPPALPLIDDFGEPLDKLIPIPLRDNLEPLVDVFAVCPELRWMENSPRFDFPRYGLGRLTLANQLAHAQSLLPQGLFLQIVGVFRPFATQKAMYDIVKEETRKKHPHWSEEFLTQYINVFSAPPIWDTPPPHTTGGAVDLGIVTEDGTRLAFVSPYEMGWDSAPMKIKGLSSEARRNRPASAPPRSASPPPYEAGELAPVESLCAPALARVQIQPTVSALNGLRGGYFLIRQISSKWGKLEYVARRQDDDAPLFRFGWLDNGDVDGVVRALQKAELSRTLYLESDGCLAITRDCWHVKLWISTQGRTLVTSRSGGGGEFKWRSSKGQQLSSSWIANTTDKQVEADIKGMLEDAESDCSFAWKWAHSSLKEQNELAFCIRKGTWDEFDSLLRFIVWSDPDLQKRVSWIWHIRATTQAQLEQGHWNPHDAELESDNFYELNQRQAHLIKLVVSHFCLHLNESVSRYTLISQALRYGDGEIRNLEVPAPSSHERLEARLRLREWLQNKVAPDEIPALLGEA